MALSAAVGQSRESSGRLAGFKAARRALQQLGFNRAAFVCFIASHSYGIQDVLAGVNEAIGDVPALGFSTTDTLSAAGYTSRSVVLGLISGDDVTANAGWWPHYVADTRGCVGEMLDRLRPDPELGHNLLVLADGLNGDISLMCSMLADSGPRLAGCLSAGDLRRGMTYQAGGRKSGSGGLAAAVLSGISIGVGVAHGWRPVGALARLSDVSGVLVRAIDGRPASETYARLFGYHARDWSQPPLSEFVRMYPLSVHMSNGSDPVVRSPLRVEVDGSLRMNSILPEGHTVDFMVSSRETCLAAAQRATHMALDDLGSRRPILALVLVDAAWRGVFESDPGAEVRIIRELLGEDVPVAGGYTLGQIARPGSAVEVQFLNQHLVVVLFGEKTVDV